MDLTLAQRDHLERAARNWWATHYEDFLGESSCGESIIDVSDEDIARIVVEVVLEAQL